MFIEIVVVRDSKEERDYFHAACNYITNEGKTRNFIVRTPDADKIGEAVQMVFNDTIAFENAELRKKNYKFEALNRK